MESNLRSIFLSNGLKPPASYLKLLGAKKSPAMRVRCEFFEVFVDGERKAEGMRAFVPTNWGKGDGFSEDLFGDSTSLQMR